MAAGDAFSFDVHSINPHTPEYNVLQTQMEGWKRKTRLKSTDPVRRWTVEVRGRTNSEKDLIVAHWDDNNGPLTNFTWNVLPAIWNTGYGTSYQVQYESMEYDNPDGKANIWDFTITFREWL
jgi:hypothetical protein